MGQTNQRFLHRHFNIYIKNKKCSNPFVQRANRRTRYNNNYLMEFLISKGKIFGLSWFPINLKLIQNTIINTYKRLNFKKAHRKRSSKKLLKRLKLTSIEPMDRRICSKKETNGIIMSRMFLWLIVFINQILVIYKV